MKNIKKKLDYKNHIYISLTSSFNPRINLTILFYHITYHKTTFEYRFSVPVKDDVNDICYRLIYNIPKRKIIKLLIEKGGTRL